MIFTFTAQTATPGHPHLVELTVEAEELPVVLEEFEAFLRGCGFHFKGTLDFVDGQEDAT